LKLPTVIPGELGKVGLEQLEILMSHILTRSWWFLVDLFAQDKAIANFIELLMRGLGHTAKNIGTNLGAGLDTVRRLFREL
jgi:hypothetical protein